MSKNTNNILFAGGATLAAIVLFSSVKGNKVPPDATLPIPSYTRGIYDGKPSTFIKFNYPFALQAQRLYKQVPVQLILAQSGLESNWGKAAPGNNFFGVKAGKNWKGEKQLLKTTEILPRNSGYSFPEVISVTQLPSGKFRWVVRDYFRKYDSPLGGYLDYCKLITSGRYADNYKKGDVYSIIDEIKKDGYATDPNYTVKLKKLADLVSNQIRTFA